MLSRNADLIAIAVLIVVFAAAGGDLAPAVGLGEMGLHLGTWKPDAGLPCEPVGASLIDLVRAALTF
jgi:hypothetical protein